MSGIWIQSLPTTIPLRSSAKYTSKCPICGPSRSTEGTKSLQIYRDSDGIIRWQCFHPGCEWNVRHATRDSKGEYDEEWEEEKLDLVYPMPFDPLKMEEIKAIIKTAEMTHWYKNVEGKYLFGIQRIKKADGTKIFRPITLLRSGDFTLSKTPKGKFLYNAQELSEKPEASVIVVEGEKAVDIGKDKFPNCVVVSWPGGANAVSRGDWNLLKGRRVLVWPDNDEPGKKAAQEVAKNIRGEVYLAYTNHLPEKVDLADDLSDKDLKFAIENKIPQESELKITSSLDMDQFKSLIQRDNTGCPTGWDRVDQSVHLNGLTIIEGRSSHGKSTVMFNLANNLMKMGKLVVFYSYEMSADEVLLNLIQLNEGRIYSDIPWENQKILSEKILSGESEGYKIIRKHLNQNLYITSENLDIGQLRRELMQPNLQDAIVFIDYIQFLRPTAEIARSPRYLQIKSYAEILQRVARENNMIVVTGSQLTAGDSPPQDVAREGKDIYNAADLVLRIWNRVEGEQTATSWSKTDESHSDGLLLVRKARAGATQRSFNFNFTPERALNFIIEEEIM